MVCPLCEHEQQVGDACDRCGLSWAPQSAPPTADEPCEGLELTQMPARPGVPIVSMPQLERGREEAPPAPPSATDRVEIELTGEEEAQSRCPNCGLMGSSSRRCFECGVRLA